MSADTEDRLISFLIELADSPELLAAFWRNPERTMAEAGLTEAERDLILSGDVGALRKHVETAAAKGGARLLVVPMVPPPVGH